MLAKESSPRTSDFWDILWWINRKLYLFQQVRLNNHIHCCMSRFQTAGISLILIRILRYFTDSQTGIQTATTDSFRQINPIFLFFKTVSSCPHVVFWRHLTEVITVAVRTQMRPKQCVHDYMAIILLLYVPISDSWHFVNIDQNP